MTRFYEGQFVRATHTITEGGTGYQGRDAASFPQPEYIHARAGDIGRVELIDDDTPTVRFERTGTATVVGDLEIEEVVDG